MRSSAPAMSGPPTARAAADTQRCGVLAGGSLQRLPLGRGDRLAGHPAYDVVRLLVSVPGLRLAVLAAHLGHRGEQRRGDDGGVHVEPGQVDHAPVRRPVELGGSAAACSGQVVSSQPWPSTTPPRAAAAGGLDRRGSRPGWPGR